VPIIQAKPFDYTPDLETITLPVLNFTIACNPVKPIISLNVTYNDLIMTIEFSLSFKKGTRMKPYALKFWRF
jgi:hypothetical protein